MRQTDDDIGIHQGAADLRCLDILPVLHGHLHLVGTPQPVGDEDLTACRRGIKAIEIRTVQMFQGMFPAAGIEGITVRQEGTASLLLDQFGHRPGVVGAQIG